MSGVRRFCAEPKRRGAGPAAEALAQVGYGLNGSGDALLQAFLNRGVEIGMRRRREFRGLEQFFGAPWAGEMRDVDPTRGNQRRDAGALGGKCVGELLVFF